jgi:exodeoxyribonuclease V alpha subunit
MSTTLSGQIEHLTFHNPDNGYTIARLRVEGDGDPVTIVGCMVEPREGESIRAEGEWVTHPRYGRQLQLSASTVEYPSTTEGIEKYLGSGLIKGIGPASARRLVEEFGASTLDVIETEPHRLLEVPSLGRKRAELIAQAWDGQRQIRDVMVFLQSHGITAGFAVRIFQQYGREAIQLLQEDPYRLERDVTGIGFATADSIAQRLGIPPEAPPRLQAGLRHLLDKAAEEGHVFLPEAELLSAAGEILRIDAGLLGPQLLQLCSRREVIAEHDSRAAAAEPSRACYYRPGLYHAEQGVAAALLRLLGAVEGCCEPIPAPGEATADIVLGATQRLAVAEAATNKAMVLTGGPGTGKTTVTRQILLMYESSDLQVSLCSPTGRAAKRLAEATGREARTIHRLLEFTPVDGRFSRCRDAPLEVDAVIVDEASMIDVRLMNALLQALPDHARLVIVGDADQLPSVGPGNVLADIIKSGVVPVVRLTEIYRQAQQSRIVLNAHRINSGELPPIDNSEDADFFFVTEERPERVAERIEDLCARRLPAHGGYDPRQDIQVLTPMYRGDTGATLLNGRLQQALNAGGQVIDPRSGELRVGDRVMQTRNNYDKNVFNGDMGTISRWDSESATAWVRFDTEVRYAVGELGELSLAYAISTHRAQGSEFRVVVMPLTTQHYVMLQRNLLYTAVTRARELIVIVGSRQALQRAVSNNAVRRRHTMLAHRLCQGAVAHGSAID